MKRLSRTMNATLSFGDACVRDRNGNAELHEGSCGRRGQRPSRDLGVHPERGIARRAHHAVGGPAARNVFPSVGHLHVTLDELTWQWEDFGQSNAIILVSLPRGEHKVRIEAVDLEGRVLTTQTVTFTSSGK
jgi:hypothetical protein